MTLLKRPCLNKMNFSWVGYKANFNWIILTVLLCFTAQFLPAQTIRVKGNIFDAETREPISFVAFYTDENEENLVFLSDFEGHFDKEIPDTFTHLIVGFTDYKTVRLNRDSIRGRVLTIELEREPVGMQGVEISLKYNPALRLIKLAQKNKDKLSPANIDHYSCETYTKNIISVNNISEKIKLLTIILFETKDIFCSLS